VYDKEFSGASLYAFPRQILSSTSDRKSARIAKSSLVGPAGLCVYLYEEGKEPGGRAPSPNKRGMKH